MCQCHAVAVASLAVMLNLVTCYKRPLYRIAHEEQTELLNQMFCESNGQLELWLLLLKTHPPENATKNMGKMAYQEDGVFLLAPVVINGVLSFMVIKYVYC